MSDVTVLRHHQPRRAVGTECQALLHIVLPCDIKASGAKQSPHKHLLKCSIVETQSAPLSTDDIGMFFFETDPASEDVFLPLTMLSSG